MGVISKGLLWMAGVVAGMAILCNLPFNPFIPAPKTATLEYLGNTMLTTVEKPIYTFKANDLWEEEGVVFMVVRRPGCSLCREAAMELSEIGYELEMRNIRLYAIVHEAEGVENFAPFLEADAIYLDTEKRFYGPQQRWMFLSGFMRASVWGNIFRVHKKGIEGNLEGEGRLLGGLFVIGPGKQGILYEHREKEWGDKPDINKIMAAVRKMGTNKDAHDDNTVDI